MNVVKAPPKNNKILSFGEYFLFKLFQMCIICNKPDCPARDVYILSGDRPSSSYHEHWL